MCKNFSRISREGIAKFWVCRHLVLINNSKFFPSWLYQFMFQAAISGNSISSSTIDIQVIKLVNQVNI